MKSQLDSIEDSELKNALQQLISKHGETGPVIHRLIKYYNKKLSSQQAQLDDINSSSENGKKRKLTSTSDTDLSNAAKILDLSFQLPARKKYTLVFSKSKLQLTNEKTQTVEHALLTSDICMASCVPTPEKPAGAYTFAIFSRQPTVDPFVFSLPEKGTLNVNGHDYTTPEDKKKAILDLFTTEYHMITKDQLAQPSRDFYVCSGVSPSTGKPDTDRTFVKTYLRTKEGVLYFLPQGVLFGFKKPTLFVPNSMIAATVITNVTKHTFDLALQLLPDAFPLGAGSTSWQPFLQSKKSNDDDTEEGDNNDGGANGKEQQNAALNTLVLPYSMIEQTDYAGIERYIQKVGISDRSMTKERKAPTPIKSSKDQYQKETDEDEEQPNGDSLNTATKGDDNDDEDEEEDIDFVPEDNSGDEDPFEYDTDASLGDEKEDIEEGDNNEDNDEELNNSPMDTAGDDELLDDDSE